MPLLRLLRVRCDALNESPPDHIRMLVHRDELDPAMWENYFGEVGQTHNIDREYSFTGTIRLEMIEVDPLVNDAIGTVTITAEPTPPDGALARFAGDDAHYTLRYHVIEVTQPSTAGPPPVCEPPPDRSEFPPQPVGSDREASCGGTGQTWVELRYRYANGRGVPHAEYYIARAGGEILARGALDANGFVHVEPLPADCHEIRYWFDNDPVEYTISREYRPIRHTWVQTELDLLIANYLQSGVDWFWGAIQGDFNENPGMGQIAFNTILGLIPFVDQALDVRDLTANVILLIGDPSPGQAAGYLRWEVWLGALLCLIGCIPEVGTVIKGVGKAVFRFGAGAAAALFRELVGILNRAGMGNAVQWLRQLLGDIPMLVRRAGDELRRVLDELSRVFDRVIARATGVWDNLVSQLRRMKQRIVDALRELPGAVERMIREWVEKLRNAIDGRQRQIGSGSTNTQNGLNQSAGQVPRGNQLPPPPPRDPNVPDNPGGGGGRPRVPRYSLADARRIIDESEGRQFGNNTGHARSHVPTEGQDARRLCEQRRRPNGTPYEHNHVYRNGRQGEQDLRDILNRHETDIDNMAPGDVRQFPGEATTGQRQGYYSNNGGPAEEGFFTRVNLTIAKMPDGSLHIIHYAPDPGSWRAGAHH